MGVTMKQAPFEIVRAQAEDAAALLDYLKIIGGETDNLSFGSEGVPLDEEAERSYLDMQAKSHDHILSCKIHRRFVPDLLRRWNDFQQRKRSVFRTSGRISCVCYYQAWDIDKSAESQAHAILLFISAAICKLRQHELHDKEFFTWASVYGVDLYRVYRVRLLGRDSKRMALPIAQKNVVPPEMLRNHIHCVCCQISSVTLQAISAILHKPVKAAVTHEGSLWQANKICETH